MNDINLGPTSDSTIPTGSWKDSPRYQGIAAVIREEMKNYTVHTGTSYDPETGMLREHSYIAPIDHDPNEEAPDA